VKRYLRHIFLLFIILSGLNAKGQTDTEFWFVAPNITSGHWWWHGGNPSEPGAVPIYLTLTAMELPAQVTITQPANQYDAVINPDGFQAITVNLNANESKTITLVDNNMDHADSVMLRNLENHPAMTINNKGLYIESTNLITSYYEVAEYFNTDIYALKGRNALGTDFYASFQTAQNLGNYTPTPYSAIDIVATEDNTTVHVFPTNPVMGMGAAPFDITLQKGETYSIIPADKRDVDDNLRGTRITTDGKKIAVTITEDSKIEEGCRDMIGDQTIPLEAMNSKGVMSPIVGKEYIVMKGNLEDAGSAYDQIYILGTENNTNIQIIDVANGDTVTTTIHQQGTEPYIINEMNNGEVITYVKADKPVYVWHITGGGDGCEEGAAVLPAIDKCTGSSKVGFARYTDHSKFILNIMVRNGAEGNFELNGDPTLIQAGDFTDIPGTPWAAASLHMEGDIAVGSSNMLINTKDIFHLGIMNGDERTGGCYGYFSDFNEVVAEGIVAGTGQTGIKSCYEEPVQLIATGGTNYEWKPVTYLNDPYISTPICTPKKSITYTVYTYGACNQVDSAEVNLLVGNPLDVKFAIDTVQGCSPLTVNITNTSYGIGGVVTQLWQIDGVNYSNQYDPPPKTFTNNSDTAQEHSIVLYGSDSSDFCIDSMKREVIVYPQINADFQASDTIGCAPLDISFTNQSTGDTTDLFYWDFGDGGSSGQFSPSHVYQNYASDDTIFNVEMIAVSSYFCRDTANKSITVSPYIHTEFTIDSTSSCASYTAQIHNNSIGVDTFFLDFGDGTDTTCTSFSTISHLYTNSDTVPHFYTIKLTGVNEEGCIDTSIHQVRVSPQVNADFSLTPTRGCDSVMVQFTNVSSGYQLSYSWDFGDGSSSKAKNPQHLYTNKTDQLIVDTIMLAIQSKYFCRDTMYDTVNIYPYIKADFAMDTVYSCPPFLATIHNQSVGVDNYTWNFDDGTQSTTSDTLFTHNYTNTSFSNDSVYALKLIVSNNFGCSDSLTRNVTVYPDIEAGFTADQYNACDPARFNFVSTSQGATRYLWNFGDNSTSLTPDSTFHQYEKNNTDTVKSFQVSLFVTSGTNQCTDFIDTVVTVNPYLEAVFSMEDYIGCTPFDAEFENASIGKIDTCKWFVNDILMDTFYDTTDVSYSLTNPDSTERTYAIRLYVSNTENCSDVYYDTVAVYPYLDADFNMSPADSGCHPLSIQFNDVSDGKGSYLWDFGDDHSSIKQNPFHTFQNANSINDTVYTVKFKIKAANCSDSLSKDVSVFAVPGAQFNIDSVTGCTPFTVTIDNNSITSTPDYTWTFGDGNSLNTSSDSIFSHVYHNTGYTSDSVYSLKLKVVNSHQCKDSLSQNVTIYPRIRAVFSADKYVSCDPAQFRFYNQSQGASTYSWNLDDGATSVSPDSVLHVYEWNNSDTVREYNVSLFVTAPNKVCTDFMDTIIRVNPYLDASFTVEDYIDCPPFTTTLANASTGKIDTSFWYVEDTLRYTGNNKADFNYTYQNMDTISKKYPVRLRVTNDEGCQEEYYDTVAVFPKVIAGFDVSPGYKGCHPFTVQFTDTSQSALNYYWDFGDLQSSKNKNPSHEFLNISNTRDTTYTVELRVNSYNCADTISKTINVYAAPKTNLIVDKSADCHPFTVTGLNYSEVTSVQYQWDFGDLTYNTTTDTGSFSHTFYNDSTKVLDYTIQLVAITDSGGCKDSVSLPIQVFPNVTADFQYDTSGCDPIEVDFTNQSRNGYFYRWEFGDGIISWEINPDHYYDNTTWQDTTYTVELVARSKYGCLDTVQKGIDIYSTPNPQFTVKPDFQVFDENTMVTVKNMTEYRENWDYSWTFGDNTNSANDSAQFIKDYDVWPEAKDNYIFRVKVVASNPSHPECNNYAIKEIVIDPPQPMAQIVIPDSTGCTPLTIHFDALYKYADTIIWDFGDGTYVTGRFTPTHTYDTAGVYIVKLTVKGEKTKEDYDYQYVEAYQVPLVDFYPRNDTISLPDATIQFNDKSLYSDYSYWDFGDGNTSAKKRPVHSYSKAGFYDVMLKDSTINGCVDSLVVENAVFVTAPLKLEFPNAFVPDQTGPTKGEYDTLDIQSGIKIFHPLHNNVKEYHLQIFNRWGEKLFETRNPMKGWDGYYNGSLCKQDVYIYKVEVKYITGKTEERVGSVTLLR